MMNDSRDYPPSVKFGMLDPSQQLECLDKWEEGEKGKPWRTRPTMFSTKLNNRMFFRNGEVTVWTGFNGHYKSMFLGQVCLDLMVQRRKVLLMSFEMPVAQTVNRMLRQCSGQESSGSRFREEFKVWAANRLRVFDHTDFIDVETCMEACRWAVEQFGPHPHIVIDNFMMVCGSEKDIDVQKRFMSSIVRFARETGSHIHLVTHCRKPGSERGVSGEDYPPTRYDVRGSGAITDLAQNVVIVWANKPKQRAVLEDPNCDEASEPDVLVTVDKQRNGSFQGKVSMWIDHASLRFMNDRTSTVEPYVLNDPLEF